MENNKTMTEPALQLAKKDFSKFPDHFEKNLTKLILEDRVFASQMQEVLELSYFKKENDYLKEIVNSVFTYKDKFGVHPASDTIDMLLFNLKDVDQNKKDQILKFWEGFKKNKKVEDHEYYMKVALDFCRAEKVSAALWESLNSGDLKNHDIDLFMEKITKAASLGSSQNFGHDYFEDFEKRYEKDLREVITLGDPLLDMYSNGGIAKGELFVYVAPRSKGKTSRMVRTATKNLIAGKNVAYFHMEMQSAEIGQKFDACLTELHLTKLKENKDLIKQKLDELPGKLKIIEEEYCATTPRRIFNKCRKLEDTMGEEIDLVVIDYMDICIPTKVLRDEDGTAGGIQVYAEVKNLGKRYNYRVLTGAQTNREGSEAEIITSKHFEGRIARFNPCDFVVGFSSFGKVAPLKTRVGEDGWILDEERDFGRVYTKLSHPDSDSIDKVMDAVNKQQSSATPAGMAKSLNDFLNRRKK